MEKIKLPNEIVSQVIPMIQEQNRLNAQVMQIISAFGVGKGIDLKAYEFDFKNMELIPVEKK